MLHSSKHTFYIPIWELPTTVTNLLPLAAEQFHWSHLGFPSQLKDKLQQLLREQGALFISFLNPNWQPFSHYPTSRLPRSDLIFFINTFHFEWCSTPLQQLRVNCHFQGHLAKSCSFVMKLSDCAFDTITILLDCSKHNKKTWIY